MNATTAIEVVGRATRSRVERVGEAAAFVADTGRAARDLRTWVPEFATQARRFGVDSLPIGMFIALFTGIVISPYVGTDSLVTSLRLHVGDVQANPKKFFSVRMF